MGDFKNLVYEKKGLVGVLKINRPEVLNALNSEVLVEMSAFLDEFEQDKTVRVLVITGEGKAFVAGADIKAMHSMTQLEGREFSMLGHSVFSKIENLSIPVIAAVNGFALGGGCELAMACDIRWASEKAKMGQPEVGLGITPGFGGTQRLARICGPAIAKELIFTGAVIDANRAREIGLVTNVLPLDTFMDEVMKLAEQIASQGPVAVTLSKAAINKGFDSTFATGAMYESEVFGLCMSHPQAKEGFSAFIEKRKADWNKE
ncbi:enoyl-CoA hydratase/isomerase family protein [bacterium]|nr:enoyl-CoA hydratase/isomerase family protein [bacterium]